MINKLKELLEAANQDIDQLVLLRNNILPELLAVVEAAELISYSDVRLALTLDELGDKLKGLK